MLKAVDTNTIEKKSPPTITRMAITRTCSQTSSNISPNTCGKEGKDNVLCVKGSELQPSPRRNTQHGSNETATNCISITPPTPGRRER